jgi:hypothetical protein
MTYNIPIKILEKRYVPMGLSPVAVEGSVLIPRDKIKDRSYRCGEDERLVLGFDGRVYVMRPAGVGERRRGRGD